MGNTALSKVYTQYAVVGGHAGRVTLPVRKQLDHRGPLSIGVGNAWYFITICAADHEPWVMGRAGAPRTPQSPAPSFDEIADVILQHAREYHQMGKWRISLFLVMPGHLHFIVHVPNVGDGVRGAPALPGCRMVVGTRVPRVRRHSRVPNLTRTHIRQVLPVISGDAEGISK